MKLTIYARARFAADTDAYIYQGSMQVEFPVQDGIEDLHSWARAFGLQGMSVLFVIAEAGFAYTLQDACM